jgi:hypothetical protein
MQNFIQILMVLAIANPLCCCTAGLFSMDAAPKADAHSCCSSTSDTAAPVEPAHDSKNCPHQSTKTFQALANQDVKNAPMHVDLLPALIAVLQSYDFVVESTEFSKVTEKTASMEKPPSITQDYCVYRI